MISVLKLI